MKCQKCGTKLKKAVLTCHRCGHLNEQEPTPDSRRAVDEALAGLPEDAVGALREAFDEGVAKGLTAEEFSNMVMVGSCPKCGSTDTGDCDDDPEINNILVATCYKCGHYWCPDCGRPLVPSAPACSCMDDLPESPPGDE